MMQERGQGWIERLERDRWLVAAIVGLALGLRVALMLALPQHPTSDAEWYLVRAAEMARGMGYQESGYPTAFWPVGYPALLAASLWLCGPSLLGPMLLNLIAAGATVALILGFSRALGARPLAGRIAALLYALYPAHIVYTGEAMSETTSTALTMAAMLLLIVGRRRWPLLLGAGLLFGLATLMRAQVILLPAGLVVAMALALRGDWRPRQALVAAALAYAGIALVLAPWVVRNERMMGAPILVSTNGGIALYTGANDYADGDWMSIERSPLWAGAGVPYADRVQYQVLTNERFQTLAKAWIAEHPRRWLALGVRKMALVWRKDSDAFWGLEASYPAQGRWWSALAALDQLMYLALLALAAATFAVAGRDLVRGRAPLALLGAMPAFVTITAFVFSGQIRYHYPAMPFVLIAAGITLERLLRRAAAPAASAEPQLAAA